MNMLARLIPNRRPAAAAAVMLPAPPVMTGYANPRLKRRDWFKPVGLTLLAFVTFIYSFFFTLFPRVLALPLLIPVLVLFLLAIWALPLTNKPPPRALDFCFWGFFVSLFLWPNYLALNIPGLPWITVSRLFGGPMILMLLIAASCLIPFRDAMGERLKASPAIWKLIAAFAVMQILSITLSDNPFNTLNKVFNNQIVWTGMFFCGVWAFRKVQRIEVWMRGYVAMTLVLCLVGIAEARAGHVLWANSTPSFLIADSEIVSTVFAGAYRLTGEYRIVTTATTPLSFAQMIALAVPFLLYFVDRFRTMAALIFGIAADALILYALVLTDSRLGFVGFILGHFFYFLYFIWEWRRRAPYSLAGKALMLSLPILSGLGVAAVLLIGRIRVHVLGGGQHSFSDDARRDQWSAAFVKIWESPVFGFGASQGGQTLGFTNSAGKITIDSHFLSILLDYGIVGFFVFYGLFVSAIIYLVKAISRGPAELRGLTAAILIFIIEFLVIESVLSQEANTPLIFMVFGAGVSLVYAASTFKKAPVVHSLNRI